MHVLKCCITTFFIERFKCLLDIYGLVHFTSKTFKKGLESYVQNDEDGSLLLIWRVKFIVKK